MKPRRDVNEASGRQERSRRTTATKTPYEESEVLQVSGSRAPSYVDEAAEKRRLRRRAAANKFQQSQQESNKITGLQQHSYHASSTNLIGYGKEALKRRQLRHPAGATKKPSDDYEEVQLRHRVRRARLKSQSTGKDDFEIWERKLKDKKTKQPNEGNEVTQDPQSRCYPMTSNNVTEDGVRHERKRKITFALSESTDDRTIRRRGRPKRDTKTQENFRPRPQRRQATVRKTLIHGHDDVGRRPPRRRATTKSTKKNDEVVLRPRKRRANVKKRENQDDFKQRPLIRQETMKQTRPEGQRDVKPCPRIRRAKVTKTWNDGNNYVLLRPQRLRVKVSKITSEVNNPPLQQKFRAANAETPSYVDKVAERRQDSEKIPSCSNKCMDRRERSDRMKAMKSPSALNRDTKTNRVMFAPMESNANKEAEPRKRKRQAISTKTSYDVTDDTGRQRKRRATVIKSDNSQPCKRRAVTAKSLIDVKKCTEHRQRGQHANPTKRLTSGNNGVELRPILRRPTTTKTLSYDKAAAEQSKQRSMALKTPTCHNDDVERRPQRGRVKATKMPTYKSRAGERR